MPFTPNLYFFKPDRCRQNQPITVAPYSKKQDLRRGDRTVAIPALTAGAGGSKAPRQRPGLIVELKGGEELTPKIKNFGGRL